MISRIAIIIGLLVTGTVLFVAHAGENSIWTDPTSKLTWQKVPTGGQMLGKDARGHCENLVLAGYNDWRLPTISELRGLIRGCPAVQTGGPCGVTDSCLKKSCWQRDSCYYPCKENSGPGLKGAYWPSELSGDTVMWYWSSSGYKDKESPVNYLWHVYFSSGCVMETSDNYIQDGYGYVRCVR